MPPIDLNGYSTIKHFMKKKKNIYIYIYIYEDCIIKESNGLHIKQAKKFFVVCVLGLWCVMGFLKFFFLI